MGDEFVVLNRVRRVGKPWGEKGKLYANCFEDVDETGEI